MAVLSVTGSYLPRGLTFGPVNGPEDFQGLVFEIFARRLYKDHFIFIDDLAVATGRPRCWPAGPSGVADVLNAIEPEKADEYEREKGTLRFRMNQEDEPQLSDGSECEFTGMLEEEEEDDDFDEVSEGIPGSSASFGWPSPGNFSVGRFFFLFCLLKLCLGAETVEGRIMGSDMFSPQPFLPAVGLPSPAAAVAPRFACASLSRIAPSGGEGKPLVSRDLFFPFAGMASRDSHPELFRERFNEAYYESYRNPGRYPPKDKKRDCSEVLVVDCC